MRELCKLKKDEIRALLPQLCTSHYICRKCARAAPDKTWLCKPISIAKLSKMNAADSAAPLADPLTDE
jgi:hypothetical protein